MCSWWCPSCKWTLRFRILMKKLVWQDEFVMLPIVFHTVLLWLCFQWLLCYLWSCVNRRDHASCSFLGDYLPFYIYLKTICVTFEFNFGIVIFVISLDRVSGLYFYHWDYIADGVLLLVALCCFLDCDSVTSLILLYLCCSVSFLVVLHLWPLSCYLSCVMLNFWFCFNCVWR